MQSATSSCSPPPRFPLAASSCHQAKGTRVIPGIWGKGGGEGGTTQEQQRPDLFFWGVGEEIAPSSPNCSFAGWETRLLLQTYSSEFPSLSSKRRAWRFSKRPLVILLGERVARGGGVGERESDLLASFPFSLSPPQPGTNLGIVPYDVNFLNFSGAPRFLFLFCFGLGFSSSNGNEHYLFTEIIKTIPKERKKWPTNLWSIPTSHPKTPVKDSCHVTSLIPFSVVLKSIQHRDFF